MSPSPSPVPLAARLAKLHELDRAVRTADNLSTYRQICAAVARSSGISSRVRRKGARWFAAKVASLPSAVITSASRTPPAPIATTRTPSLR